MDEDISANTSEIVVPGLHKVTSHSHTAPSETNQTTLLVECLGDFYLGYTSVVLLVYTLSYAHMAAIISVVFLRALPFLLSACFILLFFSCIGLQKFK